MLHSRAVATEKNTLFNLQKYNIFVTMQKNFMLLFNKKEGRYRESWGVWRVREIGEVKDVKDVKEIREIKEIRELRQVRC